MKRIILLILVVLAVSGGVFAGAELYSFDAIPVINHCRLEWATGTESNVKFFVIERSSDAQQYMAIGQVSAGGSFSRYEFMDDSPLDADVERIFYYRLKIVDRDGAVHYSGVEEASLSFSAVQHTWGTIKAIFR